MELVFDVIVLGAGAAGLMCAIEAGKRGRKVAVIERSERPGKKILISGGGRCNFTNLHCRPENFLSSNPHFAKSALARYTPADFIALVRRYGIAYHEKTLGQLFCDNSARDITGLLEAEFRASGGQLFSGEAVTAIHKTEYFVLKGYAKTWRADALVVATGGLSIPRMGATGFGYDIARQFGIKVRECRPALVPLTLSTEDARRYCDLAGASAEVVASHRKQRFREKMLITHRGLSGPAILQISSYWREGESIGIDLAPGRDLTASLRASPAGRDLGAAKDAFRAALPGRFADRWLALHAPARWTDRGLAELERRAHSWAVTPEGTEGYDKAEVTVGGVDTDELSSTTMEVKKVPGLFFVGEVVDVTGHLGGFNFQWAWSSGFCAGSYLAKLPA